MTTMRLRIIMIIIYSNCLIRHSIWKFDLACKNLDAMIYCQVSKHVPRATRCAFLAYIRGLQWDTVYVDLIVQYYLITTFWMMLQGLRKPLYLLEPHAAHLLPIVHPCSRSMFFYLPYTCMQTTLYSYSYMWLSILAQFINARRQMANSWRYLLNYHLLPLWPTPVPMSIKLAGHA